MKTAVYVDIYFRDSLLQWLDLVALLLGAGGRRRLGSNGDPERILFRRRFLRKSRFFLKKSRGRGDRWGLRTDRAVGLKLLG
jgi:hypothetical protein